MDIVSNREVAIKILKTSDKQGNISKKLMLESFYREIKILSYCRHPNIVKLLDASFNGTLIKEVVPTQSENSENLNLANKMMQL